MEHKYSKPVYSACIFECLCWSVHVMTAFMFFEAPGLAFPHLNFSISAPASLVSRSAFTHSSPGGDYEWHDTAVSN